MRMREWPLGVGKESLCSWYCNICDRLQRFKISKDQKFGLKFGKPQLRVYDP
jgi:hypothetical protein